MIRRHRGPPLVSLDGASRRVADLFQAEMEANINRQVVASELLAPRLPPPPPLPRRTRAWLWVRIWLWYRPWSRVHRMLPGHCPCEVCEVEAENW